MGRLTDDMVRLCGEIASARDERVRALRGLRREVTAMTKDLRQARAAISAQSRADRATFVAQLRADSAQSRADRATFVAQLRAEVHALRAEVATDLAAARRSFFAPQARPARPLGPGAKAAVAGRAVAKVEVAPPRFVKTASTEGKDNLREIGGIGPAIEKRLHTSGITSFAQLAHATPDELRRLLGDAGRLAKVENWIVQAKARVKTGEK